MTAVHARHGETTEQLIRRFTKAVEYSGIMEDLKEREFYKKPSSVRQEKAKEKRIMIHRRGR